MSIVLGIDPSLPRERQVAVRRNVRGWKVVGSADAPLREKPAQVVLSVPSELLTFRTLSVPFTDKKRAEDVVRQELANSLPMPLSEVHWSMCMLDRHHYLAVVSPRQRLDTLTETYKANPPDIVDAEPFSYARALASQDIKQGLVVDFNPDRTIFCVVRGARPVFVRVLLRGARSLENLQGMELRSTLDRVLADAMLPPLEPDMAIYVTGLSGSLPDLLNTLNETLQRPVHPFPLPPGLSPDTDVGAFGAALRSAAGDDGVDLMRHRPAGTPVWMRVCAALTILLALVTVDLLMRQAEASKRLACTSNAVTALLQQRAPGKSLQDLKTAVDQSSNATNGPNQSLLDIIRTVAEKAGKGVRLQEVHFGQGHTELDGQATTITEEEALKSSLGSQYKDFQLLDMHKTSDNKVHFKFRVGARQ